MLTTFSILASGKVKFKYWAKTSNECECLLILDEASMISTVDTIYSLLTPQEINDVKNSEQGSFSTIVFIGDEKQIGPYFALNNEADAGLLNDFTRSCDLDPNKATHCSVALKKLERIFGLSPQYIFFSNFM